MSLCFFSLLPIILVIIVFFIFLVLSDHSFHDFHATFKGVRVSASSCFFNFLFMRLIWFIIIFAFFLELLDVGIPDSPLSNLSSEIIGDGGASSCSPFFDWRIDSLYFSVFVVEFILHGLLYSFNIFS